MTVSNEMIDAMIAAGLSAEQMGAVIKAQNSARQAAEEAKLQKRRADTLERVRRHREAKRNAGNALQALHPSFPPDGPLSPPAPPHTPLNPPNHPGSDPSGSAAEGAAGEPEPASGEVEKPGPREVLFSRGVWLVKALTGRSDHSARAVIGHWLGLCQDEAAVVLWLIEEADHRELVDASSWITAQLKARQDQGREDRSPRRSRYEPAPHGQAARMLEVAKLIREREDARRGNDAGSVAVETRGGDDRGMPWAAGGGPGPSEPLLRAAFQGAHDSRASYALRRTRPPGKAA